MPIFTRFIRWLCVGILFSGMRPVLWTSFHSLLLTGLDNFTRHELWRAATKDSHVAIDLMLYNDSSLPILDVQSSYKAALCIAGGVRTFAEQEYRIPEGIRTNLTEALGSDTTVDIFYVLGMDSDGDGQHHRDQESCPFQGKEVLRAGMCVTNGLARLMQWREL